MDFLQELLQKLLSNIKALHPFLSKVIGNTYAYTDFALLMLGVFLIQRIFYGRAGFFLLFSMTVFTVLLHYYFPITLIEAIEHAYRVKGIEYFNQEIFLGLFILTLAFLFGKTTLGENTIGGAFLIPVFVMIESINIIMGVEGRYVTQQPFPFWGILIVLFLFFIGMI